MRTHGRIFVISGPTGSGKTTLAKKLLQDTSLKKYLARLVSYTTRPKRPGERTGVDYFFVTQEAFLRLRRQKKFLEWTRYLGYYYATANDQIKGRIKAGKCVVLCIDHRGAMRVRTLFPKQAVLFFIKPPDMATLRRRISSRPLNKEARSNGEIARRIALANTELALAGKYDFRIVNNDLKTALAELKGIVKKEITTLRA